jgi:hypothetical protein
MELRGDLPLDLERLIAVCDAFLDLDLAEQRRFILARRLNRVSRLDDPRLEGLRDELDDMLDDVGRRGVELESVFRDLRMRMV